MNYNGKGWGTICDDFWSIHDADVACKMLGFGSAIDNPRDAAYGPGSGMILFDNVLCKGTEKSLLECSYNSVGTHNCHHNEDAGIRCSSEWGVRTCTVVRMLVSGAEGLGHHYFMYSTVLVLQP